MPLKLIKLYGVWHYEGTLLPGDRLRGSTRTANKEIAAQIAAKIEAEYWQRHLHGPQAVLTFPQAVAHYLAAGKGQTKNDQLYLKRIIKYWAEYARKHHRASEMKVKDMNPGLIRQSAVDIHPKDSGATRNRQVLTPTLAIVNHCAELGHCNFMRIKRFEFEEEIKAPVTLPWLDTFCAYAVTPMIRALAVYMFSTGRRISDAKRLDWPEIDFQNLKIKIHKTKNKKQQFAHVTNRLLVELANLPRDRKPFWLSETTLRIQWDKTIEVAAKEVPGFARLTFHCCRHGATTKLLHEKIDVVTVGKLVGMTPQQVVKTYGHAQTDTTLTDTLFDTPQTRDDASLNKIKGLLE